MEDPSILSSLILQLVLILLNAVFACAEIAVVSMNAAKLAKLREQGNRNAKCLSKLTAQPSRFLSTIQVAITLAGFLGSAFAADNFAGPIVEALLPLGLPLSKETLHTLSLITVTLILSYFTIIFGELVPKRIAMKKSETISLILARPLWVVYKLFAPLVFLLTISTNLVLRLLRMDPNADEDPITEEEIRLMVDAGNKKGTIDADEKELIKNAFKFDDFTAGELCVHRTEVVMLGLDDSEAEWERIITENPYRRFPIYGDNSDDIRGVLDEKDYFRLSDRSRRSVMKNAVHKPFCVPDSIKADDLFRKMKQEKRYFAIVIDEYGGMYGILTMTDLLEALAGNFGEPSDKVEADIKNTGENEWLISGSAPLEEVAEILKLDLPTDDYETFSGYVIGLTGIIPEDDASFEIDTDRMKIRVTEIRDRRIGLAEVTLIPAAAEENEE